MVARANEAAYRAAREAAAVYTPAREVLRLVGEDRETFLHGMVTQDVKGLAVGKSAYAAMLTPKGQMVADARIWKRERELLVETEPLFGAKVKEFLEKYLISEDAEVQVAPELAVVMRFGPQATGGDEIVPREELERVAGSLPRLDEGTYEVLRVEAGVPRFGADMDESTIPLEAGLERAIHYAKGCYIGQEVIARATFRGHMNRKLAGLLLGELAPEPKTELRSGDRKIGWITTVVASPALRQNVALGYVHKDFLEPGTKVQLASGGEAEVRALPLVA
jgi:folate-binding protein YgfZ